MSSDRFIITPIDDQFQKPLEALFRSHWADFTFSGYSRDLPRPIVAMEHEASGGSQSERVVGGLAYTYYPKPISTHDIQNKGSTNNDIVSPQQVVWINALAVSKVFQGRGVARQLIEVAITHVSQSASLYPQSHLYVYTNIPQLYIPLGWKAIETETEAGHQVLAIRLKR
jgi:GNAT superfamily N-acetyltransferase